MTSSSAPAVDTCKLARLPVACHRRTSHVARRGAQRGFSLIVALLMLIVIIILGVGASQMSINEERGARSDRDKQIAFQAAEAALRDAEYEILNPAAAPCEVNTERGRGRLGTSTCFNQTNLLGYVPNCSPMPNAGLCDYNSASPAWVDSSPSHIDFYQDAMGGPNPRTVPFGYYTTRTYGSQSSASIGTNRPLSRYPPRYIIEWVPKNTTLDSVGATAHMFRITAMGFGANANTQVVLQTVVSTKD